MAAETQSSYRQIVKATSIFGGVQLYQIFLSLVRSKVVAVLLGTQGMGISGLLVSVTSLVSGGTNLGLGVSAVRNVSDANASGDATRIALIATVLRKLVWVTGIAGSLIMLALAPWLSQLTFGNGDLAWAFRLLSVTMLFTNIMTGQYVVLQGMRRLKDLAKANATGATLGLFASIPFYYYYGLDGIVPALLLSSLAGLLVAVFFGRRIAIEPVTVPWSDVWSVGKGMITMGLLLTLSGLVGMLVGYLTRIFITREGSLADVGLYSAGFAMVNTYVGMIFTAMGTDYYPRLSAVVSDRSQANKLVNQQAEIALLILGPILLLFLIVLKYAILLLYSQEFLSVIPMVQWSVLGIFLKAIVWSMGFLLVAHGDTSAFFYNELIASIYTLALNILGYHWWGLEGLGVSFLVAYFLSLFQTFFLVQYRYRFAFSADFLLMLLLQTLFGISCFVLVREFAGSAMGYWAIVIWILASGYSVYQLNRKIGLIALLRGVIKQ